MIPPHTKAIPLWNARASAARAFFFFLFIGHAFGSLRAGGFLLALWLAKGNKRWPCQRRAFLFCRFRLWPVRVPFSPLLYFLPGAGAFLFPPPVDFFSRFRQNSAAQHGPAVVPHLNLYKHKNTRFGPQKRPKIGCFFFPKSCGGKNTKNLSALIRSRRCPGRSPRR